MSDIVVLGGLGHIGLPLSIALANTGFSVDILDPNQKAWDTVKTGQMPFLEAGAQERLKSALPRLKFFTEPSECIPNTNVVICCVGTPVDEFLNPKWDALLKIFTELKPHLTEKHTIILRSTVFPGTTERISQVIGSKHIAFCPERIVEGKFFEEISKFPQIISACSDEALRVAEDLFLLLAPSVEVLTVKEAELSKLFCNAYRYIQFAAANQFYMIAESLGADFKNIRKAVMANYPRMSSLPTAGFAAGPCLLKDSMQLSAASNGTFFLGESSRLVNENLPKFIVEHLAGDLNGKVVGILGLAFKAGTDDIRDSLSYKLGKILRFKGATILYSDEYVKDSTFVVTSEVVLQAEIIIIATPHESYRSLKIPAGKTVIDLFGIIQS